MSYVATKPTVKFTYRGVDVFVDADFADFLIRSRQNGIDNFRDNTLMYIDGTPYRIGYFTLQNPTPLVEGGELEPSEFDIHINEHAFKSLFPAVKQFDYFTWTPMVERAIDFELRKFEVP